MVVVVAVAAAVTVKVMVVKCTIRMDAMAMMVVLTMEVIASLRRHRKITVVILHMANLLAERMK